MKTLLDLKSRDEFESAIFRPENARYDRFTIYPNINPIITLDYVVCCMLLGALWTCDSYTAMNSDRNETGSASREYI